MIVIEHQTRFLFPLCDLVTVLNAGEVVLTGTPTKCAQIRSSGRFILANERYADRSHSRSATARRKIMARS